MNDLVDDCLDDQIIVAEGGRRLGDFERVKNKRRDLNVSCSTRLDRK